MSPADLHSQRSERAAPGASAGPWSRLIGVFAAGVLVVGLLFGLMVFRLPLFQDAPLPPWFAEPLIAAGLHFEPSVVQTYQIDRVALLRSWMDAQLPELRRRLLRAAPDAPPVRASYHGGTLRLGFDRPGGAAAVDGALLAGLGGLVVRRQDGLTVDLGIDDAAQRRLLEPAQLSLQHILVERAHALGVSVRVAPAQRPEQVAVRLWGLPGGWAEHLHRVLTAHGELRLAAVDSAALEPWFHGLRADPPRDSSGAALVVLEQGPDGPSLRGDRRETLEGFLAERLSIEHRLAFRHAPARRAGPWEALLLVRADEVSGRRLSDVDLDVGPAGQIGVRLSFDTPGAQAFEALTRAHVGQLVAVTLDGQIYSTPRVAEPISAGQARIDLGGAKQPAGRLRAAQELVAVLRSGALPAPLQLQATRTLPPSFGAASPWLGRGVLLLAIALLSVAVALLVAAALRLTVRAVDIRRAQARRRPSPP